jgi:tRNA A-37 threonylcarbamoyl transferase component Bud32
MDVPSATHPTDRTLSSFGLGKLDDHSAASVRKHLETCPACRGRVAEISAGSFLDRPRNAPPRDDSPVLGGASLADFSNLAGEPVSSEPVPASTLPPGLADHPDYEVLGELGRGGMGVVYLAQNKLMGRKEVLKVISRDLMDRRGVVERFLREIRNAALLHHPNIVAAYSAFRVGESIVFAMEYIEGYDLAKLVKAKGPLPIAHACNFVYQAALGLQHAHEEGLVHRDIKPGNLMLSRKGNKATVKVLDFGLAKATREERVNSSLTSEGQALGTPDFIAPEQILDALSADIRADIYSLGSTLYYLLTGRPPFQAKSLYDLYQSHISRDADPLNLVRSEVPAGLAALVSKMMAKDPAHRFQTPGEVAQALTVFFRKGSQGAGVPGVEVPQSRRVASPAKSVETYAVLAEPARRPTSTPIPSVKRPTEAVRAEPLAAHWLQSRVFLAGGVVVTVLLALIAVAGGIWLRSGSGDSVGRRSIQTEKPPAPSGFKTQTIPVPGVLKAPSISAGAEQLFDDAVAAVRRGDYDEAKSLLDQYLARPSILRAEAARSLRHEIDLAVSTTKAEELARSLGDEQLNLQLQRGVQALVEASVRTLELRPLYTRTLLQAFRQESHRRQLLSKEGAPLVHAPKAAGRAQSRVDAPTQPAGGPKPAPPKRASLLASVGPTTIAPERAHAPERSRQPSEESAPLRSIRLDAVLAAPKEYAGRTIILDDLYKIGTRLSKVKGPDGNALGWSLPVGRGDDRLICTGESTVEGRDAYLLLEDGLAPMLSRVFGQLKFKAAMKPTYKCILTIAVRPMMVDHARSPIVNIVGLEILGACDFLRVAQRQYERSFQTVQITPQQAVVAYGDGASWVERLGGEEKFVQPLRRKFRELQLRMVTERDQAILARMMQGELARVFSMAAAAEQQQQRAIAAMMGRRIFP